MSPMGQPYQYKSYRFIRPASHWRKATCEEVGCPHWANGWRVRIQGLTDHDFYTATHCGRKYREVQIRDGESYLEYEAGQPCFEAHKHVMEVGIEPIYLVQRGDYRQYVEHPRRHANIQNWMEDFAEHQEGIRRIIERG